MFITYKQIGYDEMNELMMIMNIKFAWQSSLQIYYISWSSTCILIGICGIIDEAPHFTARFPIIINMKYCQYPELITELV